MDEIAEIIHEVFLQTGHEWKFSDGYRQPDVEHIKLMLEKATKVGKEEFFESGGLLVENTGGGLLDVYVYVGSFNVDTDNSVG